MRFRDVILCALTAMLATAGFSQSSGPGTSTNLQGASSATSPIEGVWRVDMDGLPAVALVITNEGGSLSGAVLFYLHHRDPGQPWTSSPGIPEPLFNPKFDGKTLTFQVSHRRAHSPGSFNDPPASFRMKLTAADKAELLNESEAAPPGVLTKTQY